jgi:hypothetical protein
VGLIEVLERFFARAIMFILKRFFSSNLLITLTFLLLMFFGLSLRLKAQTSSPYDGVSIPFESMPEYSTYRQELIRKGWQPTSVESFPVSNAFPELICGNRVCSADWRHTRGSREIMVIVWPDHNSVPSRTTYRVAPAVE